MRDENNIISKSIIERMIRRFEETGSMKNRPLSERQQLVKENKWILRDYSLKIQPHRL